MLVRRPTVNREFFEAPCELDVAADRLTGVRDAKANERDLKSVAEEAKRVQYDSLVPMRTGEDVMHLVDEKHLDADSFQKPQRRLLHLHDVGARTLRRAQQREQFGIEAP